MDVFDEPAKRSKQVIFLVTPDEKERLEEAAKKKNMTVSDLIRSAVNQYLRPKKKRE
ncbi:MAG: ribbon-helix-helix domain-containing protein [Phycisphaerales bacterium]|nr:ribbon-helix-helix domain-containing protein [Phycisphaerales bacterium]